MSRATRLCLVRHGETAWNADRRLQGHLDVPLNEKGRAQARAAAAGFAGQAIAALYCSDLCRARETAAAAGRILGLDPVPEPDLRERHYGAFQGLTYDEARERFPDEYRHFESREADFAFPGGGECLTHFAARVECVLSRIARRHAGQRVLVVTHGGVLDVAHRLATGKTLGAKRDFRIPNAGLNWFEFYGDVWRVETWADESHLQRALDELPNI